MTSTKLKFMALTCMIVDHLATFTKFMPEWFHWIGRLSAPIFIFCMAWGMHYTRSKEKYILRLYLFGVLMGLLNDIVPRMFGLVNGPNNNIFVTLCISAILIYIIDLFQSEHDKAKKYLLLFIMVQIIGTVILVVAIDVFNIYIFRMTEHTLLALTLNLFGGEGGFPFIMLAIIIYIFKERKLDMAISYIIFSMFYSLFYVTDFAARIYMRVSHLVPEWIMLAIKIVYSFFALEYIPTYHVSWYALLDYRWMIIFALPFILLYNGAKGKGWKYIFYLIYPIHIYAIYLINSIINMS